MSGGAIPASTGRLLVLVGFRQHVIIRQVSLSIAFSFFAWVERSLTGQAFSAAEQAYHSPRADDLDVVGAITSHYEFLSLRMMLFLAPTFFLVFSMCFI